MSKNWRELVSQPKYKVKVEKNVFITMRDGTRLAADIYRPDTEGKFPALLGTSPYSKDVQKLPVPRGPSDQIKGNGGIEAGDTEYFVSRGYIHVIADARGTGFSEGGYRFFTKKEQEDGYDLIEWIGTQPRCNGNVGMLGMSYFGMIQYYIAALNPPHLRAIFPVDACTDMYRQWAYHGGIMNTTFALRLWTMIVAHTLDPLDIAVDDLKRALESARNNNDIRSRASVYLPLIDLNKNPMIHDMLVYPNDGPYYWERSAYTKLDKIKIPTYMLYRWTAWQLHLRGAFQGWNGINAPKKLRVCIPKSGMGFWRPWNEDHDLILRWYDHWLKGIDTGIMDEPPISIFVQGVDKYRYEHEWPLARTKWTKFFLRENRGLAELPASSGEETDSFTNMPAIIPGQEVPSIKYMTKPLYNDTELTGPIALYIHASLNKSDANWMVEIHDIDTDGTMKLISMGWLKASHREIDESKSKPYKPFHPHTRSIPIKPGTINEYAIEICETSYVFKAGHRIQLLIKGQDAPWEGFRERERWCHLDNSKETKCTIYHTSEYPSYLLLPIIP